VAAVLVIRKSFAIRSAHAFRRFLNIPEDWPLLDILLKLKAKHLSLWWYLEAEDVFNRAESSSKDVVCKGEA
jgi:hypothetical protein